MDTLGECPTSIRWRFAYLAACWRSSRRRRTPIRLLLNAAQAGVQPDDEPQPGRRIRAARDPRGAAPARSSPLDPARERREQPRAEIPPPAGRGDRPAPGRAGRPRRAPPARSPDAGGAETAHASECTGSRTCRPSQTCSTAWRSAAWAAGSNRQPGQKEASFEQTLGRAAPETADGRRQTADLIADRRASSPILDCRLPDSGLPDFPFVHKLRVRYNECDPQNVVFNANYFTYFDITITELWREAFGSYDAMLAGGGRPDGRGGHGPLSGAGALRRGAPDRGRVRASRDDVHPDTSAGPARRRGDHRGRREPRLHRPGDAAKARAAGDIRSALERYVLPEGPDQK